MFLKHRALPTSRSKTFEQKVLPGPPQADLLPRAKSQADFRCTAAVLPESDRPSRSKSRRSLESLKQIRCNYYSRKNDPRYLEGELAFGEWHEKFAEELEDANNAEYWY